MPGMSLAPPSVLIANDLSVIADCQAPKVFRIDAGFHRADPAVAEDELDDAGVIAAELAGVEGITADAGSDVGGAERMALSNSNVAWIAHPVFF
jgi:hypothetical protein